MEAIQHSVSVVSQSRMCTNIDTIINKLWWQSWEMITRILIELYKVNQLLLCTLEDWLKICIQDLVECVQWNGVDAT